MNGMNVKESSRREIEDKIASMGDYVKMGYLSECLKKSLDFDTKKFVLIKLSALYENRKMYNEAGRCLRDSAEINTSSKNKIEEYIKSIALFVKGGHFDESDFSMKKAIGIANESEKREIMNKVRDLYRSEASGALKGDRRKYAMEVFEKLLELNLTESEKNEVTRELMKLYEGLGKMREYYSVQKNIK
jgi:hypothetical protein